MRLIDLMALLCACGDAAPVILPDASTDVVDAASAVTFTTCYVPSMPLRAYACEGQADCTECPASCAVVGFDGGTCEP